MDIDRRINGFCELGKILSDYVAVKREKKDKAIQSPSFNRLDEAVFKAGIENPWFTEQNILTAISSLALSLQRDNLIQWLQPYSLKLARSKAPSNIAVIMAGNIPLVGFHDFLCTLLAGQKFTGRLSSDDARLLPAVSGILESVSPEFKTRITFTQEKLTGFDAVIATGSNNSARYFQYYFGKYPHIIRKNRNAAAILTGAETPDEMYGLAEDIFLYFGLGCRNVSKVYLPENYEPGDLFPFFSEFGDYIQHHKYCNNHDYNASVYMLNQIPFLDNGYCILKEDNQLVSPVSVLFYEKYTDKEALVNHLMGVEDQLQVVVCREEVSFRSCRPGQAQHPALGDYADGVDTMEFLTGL